MRELDRFTAVTMIDEGLRFLIQECNDGIFDLFVSCDEGMERSTRFPKEFFSSVVALNAISGINRSSARELKSIISDMLVSEIKKRSGKISFFKDPNILPPDLDDTVLVAASLLENRNISNRFVQGVVECVKKNKRGGDGYWVYFKSEAKSMKKPNHIDLVVDINIARFLRIAGNPDFNLESRIFKILKKTRTEIKRKLRYYFFSSFLYMLGRMLKSIPNLPKEIQERYLCLAREEIKRSLNFPFEKIGACTNLAMLVTSLERFAEKTTSIYYAELLLSFLMFSPLERSWAFFRAGSKHHVYGSPVISTALTIEALATLFNI